MSVMARSSERADLRNFSRAGRGIEQLAHFDAGAVLAARPESRRDAGLSAVPPSTLISCASLSVVRLAMRQPRHRADGGQRLAAKAQGGDVREIVLAIRAPAAWRWRGARWPAQSSAVMPLPSSSTSSRSAPPLVTRDRRCGWRRHRCAFSTSSFTAAAGRSTTSPAAMRLTVPSDEAGSDLRASRILLREILPRQNLAFFHAGLIEGIDTHQLAHDDGLQHEVHHQRAHVELIHLGQMNLRAPAGRS